MSRQVKKNLIPFKIVKIRVYADLVIFTIFLVRIQKGTIMKWLFILFLTTFLFAKNSSVDVSKIYGKIKIVEHFADFKVKVVEHFADLHVQVVDNFPDKSGEWKMVQHFPDYTIQLVEHFPDFTITYVEHFPGVP